MAYKSTAGTNITLKSNLFGNSSKIVKGGKTQNTNVYTKEFNQRQQIAIQVKPICKHYNDASLEKQNEDDVDVDDVDVHFVCKLRSDNRKIYSFKSSNNDNNNKHCRRSIIMKFFACTFIEFEVDKHFASDDVFLLLLINLGSSSWSS